MHSGIHLLGQDRPDLYEGGNPEEFSDLHPAWRRDMAALAPWARLESPDVVPGETTLLWQGRTPEGTGTLLACRACASSQDAAFALVQTGALPLWGGLVAGVQSSGRGQLRRVWVSGPGNVHLSVRWPLPFGADQAWNPILSLAVGSALAEALNGMDVPVQLKWPNDILWQEHKVGGVLLEDRAGELVVGIGLNLDLAPPVEALREGHAVPAASFRDMGSNYSPLTLAWALVNRMQISYLNTLRRTAPNDFLHSLSCRLAWMGRMVCLDHGQERVCGTMQGLAGDGGLILLTGEGSRVFHSGSVTPVERVRGI